MQKILVVRHGETYGNAEGVVLGQMDSPLNARGLEQAERVAEYLSQVEVNQIVSSDLGRAKATAEIILRKTKARHLYLDSRLREASFGVLEGQKISALEREGIWEERRRNMYYFVPASGESYVEVESRISSLIADDRYRKKSGLVFVTHVGVLRVLACLTGFMDRNAVARFKPGVCSCWSFLLSRGHPSGFKMEWGESQLVDI